MAGIISYGAYVPFNRICRSTVGAALGKSGGKGERAVASYDEDTVTMAVEAVRACLAGRDRSNVGSLYFATTEPPYMEKLNAATVHAAARLDASTRALDLGGSVRAGLGALLTAHETAGRSGGSLAAMSDIRIGAPEGEAELAGGDGAAAFLMGDNGTIAEVVSTFSETHEYLATWRLPGEAFSRSWESRFLLSQAYIPLLSRAAKALLSAAGIPPNEISAAVIDAPSPRAARAVAKTVGLDPERVVDDMSATVGHSGAAHAGLMLASVLDRARPGERILVLSVSDGVDGVLLEATPGIDSHTPVRSVEGLVGSKRNDLAYTSYLKWRGILETQPPRRPDPERPAAPPSLRSEPWKFGFMGSKCEKCGANHLPPQIVCVACGEAGQMTDVPFADRRANIKTYTVDRLAFTPQPPMVVAVIDFEGGGRFQSELTDCEPERVKIGDAVEMTFRRLFTAGGVHNYFWKARPQR